LRIGQHKLGLRDGFAKTFGCHRLLLAEPFSTITEAIAREKQLKGWRRDKKLLLIRKSNPEFKDLAKTWTYERLGPTQSISK
jgi:putative endonuclease